MFCTTGCKTPGHLRATRHSLILPGLVLPRCLDAVPSESNRRPSARRHRAGGGWSWHTRVRFRRTGARFSPKTHPIASWWDTATASPTQNCTAAAFESCGEVSLQSWTGLSRLLAGTTPIIRFALSRAIRLWRRMHAVAIGAMAWAWRMTGAGLGCLPLRIQRLTAEWGLHDSGRIR